MIVVTSATGALNGATVEQLLKRIPADRIGVRVRDMAKADSPFHPACDHAATRAILADSGPWQQTGSITAPANVPRLLDRSRRRGRGRSRHPRW